MPDHEPRYRSLAGSCFSLFTIILVISYAAYKLIDLLELNDYKLQEAVQENFFTAEVPLTPQDHGFMVAAAITAYDGSSEVIEDPEIGTLKMYIKYWGNYEGSDGSFGFREVETELCSQDDFNNVEGTNTKSKFFRADPETV